MIWFPHIIYYTIDNMAKTVPVNIKISLLNLTETLYRFNYDYDYSTIKPDDLKVDFIHSFKSDQEKRRVWGRS